jgi:hypothetical protein
VSPPRTRVVQAPMAVTSDGMIVVNATHLAVEPTLDAAIRYAKESGHDVFVGVVVPRGLRDEFVREVDDALADVVGRLGPRLTSSAVRASASSPSSVAQASARRDRPEGRAPRPRGRRP